MRIEPVSGVSAVTVVSAALASLGPVPYDVARARRSLRLLRHPEIRRRTQFGIGPPSTGSHHLDYTPLGRSRPPFGIAAL
jgi:hypothetical protein